MLTNLELYNIINSEGDLWKKAEIGFLKAAIGIKYEAADTPNHNNRMAWANDIFNSPSAFVQRNKIKLLENPTLNTNGNTSSDNDVDFVCASLAPVAA